MPRPKLTVPATRPTIAPGPSTPAVIEAKQPDTLDRTMAALSIPAVPAQTRPSASEPIIETATTAMPPREKTLNELNIEARAIDHEHARRREEADRVAREVVGPLLENTLRGRQRMRRYQKPITPPYTVPKAS